MRDGGSDAAMTLASGASTMLTNTTATRSRFSTHHLMIKWGDPDVDMSVVVATDYIEDSFAKLPPALKDKLDPRNVQHIRRHWFPNPQTEVHCIKTHINFDPKTIPPHLAGQLRIHFLNLLKLRRPEYNVQTEQDPEDVIRKRPIYTLRDFVRESWQNVP